MSLSLNIFLIRMFENSIFGTLSLHVTNSIFIRISKFFLDRILIQCRILSFNKMLIRQKEYDTPVFPIPNARILYWHVFLHLISFHSEPLALNFGQKIKILEFQQPKRLNKNRDWIFEFKVKDEHGQYVSYFKSGPWFSDHGFDSVMKSERTKLWT